MVLFYDGIDFINQQGALVIDSFAHTLTHAYFWRQCFAHCLQIIHPLNQLILFQTHVVEVSFESPSHFYKCAFHKFLKLADWVLINFNQLLIIFNTCYSPISLENFILKLLLGNNNHVSDSFDSGFNLNLHVQDFSLHVIKESFSSFCVFLPNCFLKEINPLCKLFILLF